jgi:uncharacterized protein
MSGLKGTAVVTGATGGVGALAAPALLISAAIAGSLDIRASTRARSFASARLATRVSTLTFTFCFTALARASSVRRWIGRAGIRSPACRPPAEGSFGPFAKLSSEAVDETTAVNITALTRLTHAVLPGLLARGAGSIVNIASVLAFHPWPEFGVYNASKAYVVSFSQALQGEVAGKGVLVQVVTPPAIDTDFWNKAGLPVSNLPAGSVMKPQHMVDAALKGLDRGESWVFPSLPDQALWNDYEKSRQALVGGLMNGAPAVRYAA